MNAIFFEASHDATTLRVHLARRKSLGTTIAIPEFRLYGGDATHYDVRRTHQRTTKFDLFSGIGHGGIDEFCGHYDWELFDKGDKNKTNYTIKGAVVHLYSCDCAQWLGYYLVAIGAKAFIGYNQPVSVPSEQSVVDEFVKVAAAIDKSVLNGDTHKITKQKADIAAQAVEAALLAVGSSASPRDLARFRMNQSALVGPWTSSGYGTY